MGLQPLSQILCRYILASYINLHINEHKLEIVTLYTVYLEAQQSGFHRVRL